MGGACRLQGFNAGSKVANGGALQVPEKGSIFGVTVLTLGTLVLCDFIFF